MLIEHPRIYLDATGARTDALLVRHGEIAATGDDARHGATADDRRLRPDATCLFPALGDAHIHLWGLGQRAGTVDLSGCTVDETLQRLSDASPTPTGWVFATNLDDHQFDDATVLSRQDLDRLFPDVPVVIHRVDRHALWVNSTALDRADFSSYDPGASGRIIRNDRGEATGVLVDSAMEPMLDAVPDRGLAEDRDVLFDSCRRFRDQGVAFGTVAWAPTSHLPMLQQLDDDGALPMMLDVLIEGVDDELHTWLDDGPYTGDDLRIGGVKFFADGALGSGGAHLLEPYRDGGTGLKIHDDGFLKRRIPQIMERGWQVAVHAIGDAAVREVLDAYAATDAKTRSTLRPRVEHAQMVSPDDCRRFVDLDVIASIQPIHLRSDAPWADQKLNPRQLRRLFPWRSLPIATMAAGSDYPIDDPNPWHGIATALTRHGAEGEAFRPDDALARTEILKAYTQGAAYASHREDQLGTLHPGFRAAIAALDTDPLAADPEDIWDTHARLVDTGVLASARL